MKLGRLKKVKKEMSEFHSMFSSFVKTGCKEILRRFELTKHIVNLSKKAKIKKIIFFR